MFGAGAHRARHSAMQCSAKAVTQLGQCGSKARPNLGLTTNPALSNVNGSFPRTNPSSAENGTEQYRDSEPAPER